MKERPASGGQSSTRQPRLPGGGDQFAGGSYRRGAGYGRYCHRVFSWGSMDSISARTRCLDAARDGRFNRFNRRGNVTGHVRRAAELPAPHENAAERS